MKDRRRREREEAERGWMILIHILLRSFKCMPVRLRDVLFIALSLPLSFCVCSGFCFGKPT